MIDTAIVEAVLLGIVQGIAEFLPISSSGHLVILGNLLERGLGIHADETHNLALNVALHVGTLGSILVVYRKEIVQLLRQFRLCLAIVMATIPAGLAGVLLADHFKKAFATPLVAGCCLVVTAVLLLAGQSLERNKNQLEETTLWQAIVVGVFQAFALLPGISRSGSTIAAGLFTGLQRQAATTFSFLIAIPAIGGAATLTAWDAWQAPAANEPLLPLCLGALVSFVVGLFSLRWLIQLVSQRKLHWFAYYCLVVAVLTITWQLSAVR